MNQKLMGKQMLRYHRSSFDKSFATLVSMQDNAEKMFNFWMNQARWFPEEGKRFMNEWTDYYRKLRNDFKASVEEGYRKMDDYLSED